MAANLSRDRFDRQIPLHRRICEKSSFLDAPGRPRFAGFMTPPGIQTKVVSGIALPPRAAGGEQPARSRPSQCPGPRKGAAAPDADHGVRHRSGRESRGPDPLEQAGRAHPREMTTFAGRQVRHMVASARPAGSGGATKGGARIRANAGTAASGFWTKEARSCSLDRHGR